MKRRRKKVYELRCDDCRKDCFLIDRDYFMVKNDVWRIEAGLPQKKILCYTCLEVRLGRPLVREDYLECPLNHMNGLLS